MGCVCCIIWFLCLWVSGSWRPVHSQPVMQGQVQSPGFPQPYPPNFKEKWFLWVPKGYKVQLSITHLDIKESMGCSEDSLMVLEGERVLGKFCGKMKPSNQIVSQGNRLDVIFNASDFSPELQKQTGYFAKYKAIDINECLNKETRPVCSQVCINTPGSYHCKCRHGYTLHRDKRTCLFSCAARSSDNEWGRISSPEYPQPSPPLLSCKYIISVDPGLSIILNFTENFHIESVDTQQGPSCPFHWLQVTTPDRDPMKLCGETSPGVIDTHSSTVRLDYHTDIDGLSLGWSLDYSTYRINWTSLSNASKVIECGAPEPLLNGGVTLLSGLENQYRSVIQYHCNEPFYSLPDGVKALFTCAADGRWRSIHTDVTPKCFPVCGKPTKLISTYARIIGGGTAPEDTIPWQVLLNIGGRRGGGMVIADRWIMTAANDLTYKGEVASNESVQIYMGSVDVETLLRTPAFPASIHIHPEFNNVTFANDIALIKLQEPITFNSSVMPICLPAVGDTYVTGLMGLVSGFGIMGNYPPRVSNKLKYAHLPLVEQGTCRDSVRKLINARENLQSLTNNIFCAGLPEGGKDSCLGDTGGPFALKDDGQFWAAGIISWGPACGQQGIYRVYTRVSSYLDWINMKMQE